MRVDDVDPDSKLGLGDLNRQLEIGVVGDHDGHFAVALEGVEQQVGGEIDVRALLLGLHDLDRARTASRRVGEWHPRDVGEVVAVVDREAGNRLERAQVDLLPLRRVRVVGPGADGGGEVTDAIDPVLGQQASAEGAESSQRYGVPLRLP